jgi:uncharacterized membrane protein YhaH (DUF805 family)
MTSPTGSDQNYPQGGAPGGQPGWGTPAPGGYSPAPSYAGAPAGPMSLPDAVRSVLTQYANFSGRARRSEFWWFYLANFLASIVASIIDAAFVGGPLFQWILLLALLVPGLAVGARRLHDTGRSGWWQLIGLVPLVGIIVLIVFWAQEGHAAPNAHGPSPKYPTAVGY